MWNSRWKRPIAAERCPWSPQDGENVWKGRSKKSLVLKIFPDHFKTEKMCEKAAEDDPYTLKFVPDHFKSLMVCEGTVEVSPWQVKFVPDHFKMDKMCDKAVWKDSSSLQYVPDWFVTREGLYMWYDDSEYRDDDENNFFKWCNGYKKRKGQKASIKGQLLPVAWHPSRWWDWCMSEEENKETKTFWG